MNLVTLGRRRLCATGALLLLVACSGAPTARAEGIRLFAKPKPHRTGAAGRRHKRKSTGRRKPRRLVPRGPIGPAGPIGPTGPQGPAGAVGPQGPGAFKFGYYGKPTAGDTLHAVLPVGPFQLSASCLPGAKKGEVEFKAQTTVPAALDYTQTLETLSSSGTQPPPEVTEGEEAATLPALQAYDVASGKEIETWATIALTDPATGATTWLELWYGAKATATPVCYMSGIEV